MYDDLIAQLREKGNWLGFTEQLRNLFCNAAIAIEELSLIADSNERSMEAWANEAALAQPKWTPADEKKPSDFVSVQAHMTDAGLFPSVREGYVVHGEWFIPALGEFHPVDKWMPFSEPGEG